MRPISMLASGCGPKAYPHPDIGYQQLLYVVCCPLPQLPHGGRRSLASSRLTDHPQFVQQQRPMPGFSPMSYIQITSSPSSPTQHTDRVRATSAFRAAGARGGRLTSKSVRIEDVDS